MPIAFETLGAIGPKSLALLKDLGRCIRSELGELKSTEYLLQRLSVAVQRVPAPAAVSGSSEGTCSSGCQWQFRGYLLQRLSVAVQRVPAPAAVSGSLEGTCSSGCQWQFRGYLLQQLSVAVAVQRVPAPAAVSGSGSSEGTCSSGCQWQWQFRGGTPHLFLPAQAPDTYFTCI